MAVQQKEPAETAGLAAPRDNLRSTPEDKPAGAQQQPKSATKATVAGNKSPEQPLQGDQGDDFPDVPVKGGSPGQPVKGQEMQRPRYRYMGGDGLGHSLRAGQDVFMFEAGPGTTAYVRGVDWPEDRGNELVARSALQKVQEQG